PLFQMPRGATSVIVCDPTGSANCCAVPHVSVDVRVVLPSLTVNGVVVSLAAQVLATMRVPCCRVLVNVQVTFVPAASVMAPGALPLSQVELVRSHPEGTVSATE